MSYSVMAGRPFKVGRFAHTLRVRLMREHLGVDVDGMYEEDVEEEAHTEEQPVSPTSQTPARGPGPQGPEGTREKGPEGGLAKEPEGADPSADGNEAIKDTGGGRWDPEKEQEEISHDEKQDAEGGGTTGIRPMDRAARLAGTAENFVGTGESCLANESIQRGSSSPDSCGRRRANRILRPSSCSRGPRSEASEGANLLREQDAAERAHNLRQRREQDARVRFVQCTDLGGENFDGAAAKRYSRGQTYVRGTRDWPPGSGRGRSQNR